MKAKLIKIEEGYELLTQGFLKGSTNHELIDSLNSEEGNIRYKLSLKNCQAIERGYDLDELAEKEYPIFNLGLSSTTSLHTLHQESFKAGFQKALELMGDKKFSEEDMGKAWSEGYHRKVDELNGNGLRYFDKFIQSLQQTEWDVEVVMECCGKVYSQHCDGICEHVKPLLDADGCLILKRI